MLRNPDLKWTALVSFARSMSTTMEAGVEIRKSIATSSRQSTDHRLAAAADNIQKQVTSGKTLTEAIEAQGALFPRLFIDLVHVGELTGNVPEVFAALARYYDSRVTQIREFRSAITSPILQLVAAIGIIGFVIFVLGILPPQANGATLDVTGLGLAGASGALIWYGAWLTLAIGGYIGLKVIRNNVYGKTVLDSLLLRIPVLGTCLRSFAISRFAWCFSLTQQAGMSIKPSLECSLKATDNSAFLSAFPTIWQSLSDGETLTDALTESHLFPPEFLQFVLTAEETGTVPEQLDRLSHVFEADARGNMVRLTSAMGQAVWVCMAGFIIFFVIRFAMNYVVLVNDAAKEALGG